MTFGKNSRVCYLARWQLHKSVLSLLRKEHERKLFSFSSSRNSKGILLVPTSNIGNAHRLWAFPLKPWNKLQCYKWGCYTWRSLFFNQWKEMISVLSNHYERTSKILFCEILLAIYGNLIILYIKCFKVILLLDDVGI